MSKIVVLKGSPRKNGNSSTMADAFIRAAEKDGNEVVSYDTADLKIGGCRGCMGCLAKKECVFKDDFQKVAADLIDADGIVISAPVYWYTFPAQIKALIDRWFSLYVGEHLFTGKKTALICCCEENEKETFTGVLFAYRKTMELMNANMVGEVLVNGVSAIGDIDKTDGVKQAEELYNRFK